MKITSLDKFKKLLFTLIIIFSLQSFTKADEIKSFEVEGITIGDTLLKFYSEEQIANQSLSLIHI